MLALFLQDLTVMYSEYERSARYSVFTFISNVGGVFGLFLGFSLISFAEIFYWFLVKIPR